MRKRTFSIILILIVVSSWNSYSFAEPSTISAPASTSQQMMDEHCDHNKSDTPGNTGMGCLEHCAAIYALPNSHELNILKIAGSMEAIPNSFKLIPELSSHWRPPSPVS